MAFDRNAYMADYMAKVRKGYVSQPKRMRAALELIRDELATSNTDKGKRLHTAAVEALS